MKWQHSGSCCSYLAAAAGIHVELLWVLAGGTVKPSDGFCCHWWGRQSVLLIVESCILTQTFTGVVQANVGQNLLKCYTLKGFFVSNGVDI